MAEDQETLVRLAKEKLAAAVHDYYSVIEPDTFVSDWILIIHKESSDLHARGMSGIRWTTDDEQPYHRTVGLITVAQNAIMNK